MKKEDYIAKYGEDAYKQMLARKREYSKEHREEAKARKKKYQDTHPEKVEAAQREKCRKGGKYYEAKEEYQRTGLQGERQRVRGIHGAQYRPLKKIIAPDSQIHHEWIPQTAKYRGVALVEATPHQYGIIDVILILDGKITLLTEKEVKKGEVK